MHPTFRGYPPLSVTHHRTCPAPIPLPREHDCQGGAECSGQPIGRHDEEGTLRSLLAGAFSYTAKTVATERTIDVAYRCMRPLVDRANSKIPITYRELGSKVGEAHWTFTDPLDYIWEEFCRPRSLPKLHIIVINKRLGRPKSKVFAKCLPRSRLPRSEEGYDRLFEELRDEVFDYGDWNDLLSELGLAASD